MIIRVNGRPAAQGNHSRNASGAIYETSKAAGPWREAIRAEVQRAMSGRAPAAGAVSLDLWLILPRPKSHYRTGARAGELRDSAPARPTGRPDIDKLTRAVLDGLTAGGAVTDDSLVVDLAVSKLFTDQENGAPGVVIELKPAEGSEQ